MDTSNFDVAVQIRRMTRRGVATAGVAMLAGYGGWRWLVGSPREGGLVWPLRRVLQFNERLGRATFDASRLAPEYPRARALEPRLNGGLGSPYLVGKPGVDPKTWFLTASASHGALDVHRTFSLDELRALPRAEHTTELKCIEGWSAVTHWAGARLADLAAATGLSSRSVLAYDPASPRSDLFAYAGMATADGGYYVGLDTPSALHPQTLLCYEMNGEPLTWGHGAPLRLVIPVKYGIKNIKWVDRIWFSDQRPADYWAEQGYDWYSGH